MSNYVLLLHDHVTLLCRSIYRIFLQAYVPRLQAVGEVCTFLRWQRKFPIPSSAAFGKIGEEYVEAVYRFAEAHHIPVVHFKKGQNKEEVARPYLEAAANEGKDRVVLIGIAQEKASVWRSWPRKGQEKARHPHMDWAREMAFINHFYFYLWDAEWGSPARRAARRLIRAGARRMSAGKGADTRADPNLAGAPSKRRVPAPPWDRVVSRSAPRT